MRVLNHVASASCTPQRHRLLYFFRFRMLPKSAPPRKEKKTIQAMVAGESKECKERVPAEQRRSAMDLIGLRFAWSWSPTLFIGWSVGAMGRADCHPGVAALARLA